MALKNIHGNYIKLSLENKVEVFKTEEIRQRIKSSPSYEEICGVYEKLLETALTEFKNNLIAQDINFEEIEYNLTEEIFNKFSNSTKESLTKYEQVGNEYIRYKKYRKHSQIFDISDIDSIDLYLPIITNTYLTYKDIKNTLIKPIEAFYIDWKRAPKQNVEQDIDQSKNDIESIYLLAKKLNIFGETEDC